MNIYLNGVEVYVDGDQAPAITLRITDILDPSSIKGSTSSTIRILNTPESRAVLGNESPMWGPKWTDIEVLFRHDGLDVFRGKAVLLSATRDVFEVVAAGGNAAWMDWAKRTKLNEFDFGETPAPYGANDVLDAWGDPHAVLCHPIIDFGYLEGRSSSFSTMYWRLRPAARILRMLKSGFADAGYTVVPKGSAKDVLEKMLLLGDTTNARTPHFYGHPEGASAATLAPSLYTLNDLGGTAVAFDLALHMLDPGSNMSGSTYTVPSDGVYSVRVDGVGITIDPFSPPADGEIFYCVLYDFTSSAVLGALNAAYHTGGADNVVFHGTFIDIPMTAGHSIGLSIHRTPGGYSGDAYVYSLNLVTFEPRDILHERQYFKWNDADITYFTLSNSVPPIVINSALPPWTFAELLASTLNNQCLVVDTKPGSNTIEIWRHDELFRSPAFGTLDITERTTHDPPPVKRYAASPKAVAFRLAQDDGDKDLILRRDQSPEPRYGNADIDIDGQAENDTVEVKFAPSVMGEMFGNLTAPVMRKKDGVYQEDDYARTPRLLMHGGMRPGNWRLMSAYQTDYPFAYFVDEALPDAVAHFGTAPEGGTGTAEKYWRNRISRMASASMEVYVRWHDHEIADFDFGRPVLLNDGHATQPYYVTKIEDYRVGSGMPAKTTLIPA